MDEDNLAVALNMLSRFVDAAGGQISIDEQEYESLIAANSHWTLSIVRPTEHFGSKYVIRLIK